jgi:hypothetical protein
MVEMQRVIEGLPKLTAKVGNQLASQIADKYLEIVKYHLEAQDLPWKPLAPEYKAWKKRKGLDTRIWIATGKLEKLIKKIKVEPGNYLVGISGEKQHSKSGISAGHLAMVHEYGVPQLGIPARPRFRPSYHELRARLKVQLDSMALACTRTEVEKIPRVKK